jgi:hypothetical protein
MVCLCCTTCFVFVYFHTVLWASFFCSLLCYGLLFLSPPLWHGLLFPTVPWALHCGLLYSHTPDIRCTYQYVYIQPCLVLRALQPPPQPDLYILTNISCTTPDMRYVCIQRCPILRALQPPPQPDVYIYIQTYPVLWASLSQPHTCCIVLDR